MSNNFNEKLKKSFQGGSEAKAATAVISSRIKAAVRIGLFALPVLWFIGFVSEPKQNDLVDSIVKKGNMGNQDTPQKGQQGSSGQQGVKYIEATWKSMEADGTIPVGHKSNIVTRPGRCQILIPKGQDVWYRAWYRLDDKEWKILPRGKGTALHELTFEILEKGKIRLKYELHC